MHKRIVGTHERETSKAAIYVQRIDWLLSDDDGEDNFHERLKEELDALKKKRR